MLRSGSCHPLLSFALKKGKRISATVTHACVCATLRKDVCGVIMFLVFGVAVKRLPFTKDEVGFTKGSRPRLCPAATDYGEQGKTYLPSSETAFCTLHNYILALRSAILLLQNANTLLLNINSTLKNKVLPLYFCYW